MATTPKDEEDQIQGANKSGRTPVVFIHGLWLLPSSWDRWATVFEEAGYAPLTPGWPDDPDTVEEAKAHPEVFANKTIGQVADHYADVIGKLNKKPAVIGHSFGGLLAQILAGRGLSAAIGGHRPRPLPRRAAAADLGPEVGQPVLEQSPQPAPRHPPDLRPVPLRLRQRRQRGRSQGAVRDVRGARPGAPLFQAAAANLNPWTEAKVDTENPDRGPLLIISGEKDHTVPRSIADATFKRQQKNQGVTEFVEMPGPGPRPHHRQRLARGCRHRSRLREALRLLISISGVATANRSEVRAAFGNLTDDPASWMCG